MDSSLRGWRVSHPKLLAHPSQTRHLVLRETAFVHKEYKEYVEFIHSSGGAGGEQLAPEAHLTVIEHVAPTPRCTLKVIE